MTGLFPSFSSLISLTNINLNQTAIVIQDSFEEINQNISVLITEQLSGSYISKKKKEKKKKKRKRKEKEKNDPNFKLFFPPKLIGFRDKNEEMLKTTSIIIDQFLDQISPFFKKIYSVQNLVRVFFSGDGPGDRLVYFLHMVTAFLFASSLLVFFIYGFGLRLKKSSLLTWYFNLI